MNVGDLKKVIAALCKKNGVPEDFMVAGTDLLLQALNNAKIEAEQLCDFELSKTIVDVPIDAYNGAELSEVAIHGTDYTCNIKAIRDGGFRNSNGSYTQVGIMGLETYNALHRKGAMLLSDDDMTIRYPGDNPGQVNIYSERTLTVHGEFIYTEPRATEPGTIYNAELNVLRWLGPYQDDSDEDFLTNYCHNYMQWAGVVEVNHLTQQFVARQEGGLNAPKDLKERAWTAVMTWNDFLVEGGRIPEL